MKDKEEDRHSSVWNRYVEAKQHAFGAPPEKEGPMTLEELEAAIAIEAASSGVPETGMPPRSVIHPSNKPQYTKAFYLILVILFSSLVLGLIWWGRKHYG